MKRLFYSSVILGMAILIFYLGCHLSEGNLKVILSFQYNGENDISHFIDNYARKIVVSVYGNNMLPVQKSVDFPTSPHIVCRGDGGYYEPTDSENMDCYFHQFAIISISLDVPAGVNRSVVVETLGKDNKVTFRGSLSDLTIEDNTAVDVELKPVAAIEFSVYEIRDVKSSRYEEANSGKLRAYYFERGKVMDGSRRNYATLIGEQVVSKGSSLHLEFEYSPDYYEFNEKERKTYYYPSLFGYYRGDNDFISFVMPGLAESYESGLEPGANYKMSIYAAMRDVIKNNPVITAVTPSILTYRYYSEYPDYGMWDWTYAYLSYIHAFPESSIKIRVFGKVDTGDEWMWSTDPEEQKPFPNEVYDIGRLEGLENDLYMGFKNIPLYNFEPQKNSGDITFWMEIEDQNGKKYKTNEVKIKYNVEKTIPISDDGGYSDQ